jgi:hypothetical protein
MTEEEIAIDHLKRLLSPGDTIYAILRWVNGHGDNRIVDFYCVHDGQVAWLSGRISRLWPDTGGFEPTQKHGGGLYIGGSGMDAANEVIYALGSKLFDDGHALKREWL